MSRVPLIHMAEYAILFYTRNSGFRLDNWRTACSERNLPKKFRLKDINYVIEQCNIAINYKLAILEQCKLCITIIKPYLSPILYNFGHFQRFVLAVYVVMFESQSNTLFRVLCSS